MDPKIIIKDLNLSFGKQQVLKNINVEIPANQITVILGPSGCGKTTLLRCLNRLTDLQEGIDISGSIGLNGEDILHTRSDITDIRKKMGLLSQRPYPLPMSIFDNVAYGMRIHGLRNRKEIRQRVEKYLIQANLWEEVRERLHEPAARLSIGQQQRLCLARGLAVEPEIILADEPTSALDPISSKGIEEQFVLLKKDYTLVMVTHILRQARRLADHVIFLYMGEVVEQGPARELFNNPKEERTKMYFEGMFN
jgi:phosphate transport system ATP-binding protein